MKYLCTLMLAIVCVISSPARESNDSATNAHAQQQTSTAEMQTHIKTTGGKRQLQRGYRGFIDWNNEYYLELTASAQNCYYTGITTSHGYQFNRYIFVGGGVALIYWPKDRIVYYAPIFAHLRADSKFGGFIEAKIGLNMIYERTLYFSPTIGYRINWGRRVGINIGIGATFNRYNQSNDYAHRDIMPTARLGIDF